MARELPPICLLAGGLGTRLGETVRDTPKPLLNVAGEPFLIHQLRLLAGHGAARVVLCVGYLGELIAARIGPSQFGIDISYSYDGPSPIGTLGAVRKAAPALGDRFLILYGDTYLRLDYRAVAAEWEDSGLPALMTVLRNEGQWDVSNVCFDGTRVIGYDKRAPGPEMSWIDYGLGGLRPTRSTSSRTPPSTSPTSTTSWPGAASCSGTKPSSGSTRSAPPNRWLRPASSWPPFRARAELRRDRAGIVKATVALILVCATVSPSPRSSTAASPTPRSLL